jgi:hypothetical protein
MMYRKIRRSVVVDNGLVSKTLQVSSECMVIVVCSVSQGGRRGLRQGGFAGQAMT